MRDGSKRPAGAMALCALAAIGAATAAEPAASWPGKAERDAAAGAMDAGESAPDWLVESETYAFGGDPKSFEALGASKVAFVTHCPTDRQYFERVHPLGIRAFPYITLYQGCADRTCEGVNLKDHPEFMRWTTLSARFDVQEAGKQEHRT
jgi:hypothetical protein